MMDIKTKAEICTRCWSKRELCLCPPGGLLIALDFDGTFNADRDTWLECARLWLAADHELITVTSRKLTPENLRVIADAGVTWPVVFAYDKPKKLAAIEAGYHVDIWVDDHPQGIGDGTESTSTQTVFEVELRHAADTLRRRVNDLDLCFRDLLTRLETVI